MEDFLIGLALMAIGGLVATAINYPRGFERIRMVLAILLFMSSLIWLGYEWGFGRGVEAMRPLIAASNAAAVEAAAKAAQAPDWIPFAGASAAVFLWFLIGLRRILAVSNDGSKDGDAKDEQEP